METQVRLYAALYTVRTVRDCITLSIRTVQSVHSPSQTLPLTNTPERGGCWDGHTHPLEIARSITAPPGAKSRSVAELS
jgi:hypothetical protein